MKTNINILKNLENSLQVSYSKNNKNYKGFCFFANNQKYIYSFENNILYKANEVFIFSNNPLQNILN